MQIGGEGIENLLTKIVLGKKSFKKTNLETRFFMPLNFCLELSNQQLPKRMTMNLKVILPKPKPAPLNHHLCNFKYQGTNDESKNKYLWL